MKQITMPTGHSTPTPTAWLKWPGMFLLALSLSLTGVSAWADEEEKSCKHDPQSRLERLIKLLDLNKDQQDKILPIIEEGHKKMEALHSQMKDIRQDTTSQIEAQLTPQQQATYQKAREERKERMKEYKEKRGKGEGKGHGKGHGKGKHGKGDHQD